MVCIHVDGVYLETGGAGMCHDECVYPGELQSNADLYPVVILMQIYIL